MTGAAVLLTLSFGLISPQRPPQREPPDFGCPVSVLNSSDSKVVIEKSNDAGETWLGAQIAPNVSICFPADATGGVTVRVGTGVNGKKSWATYRFNERKRYRVASNEATKRLGISEIAPAQDQSLRN